MMMKKESEKIAQSKRVTRQTSVQANVNCSFTVNEHPSSFMLNSCVPMFIGTGITAGGYAIRNEKGIGGKISDVEITVKVDDALGKLSHKWKKDIFYVVKNSDVLIVGSVPNVDAKHSIIDTVKSINNVQNVYDETKIGETYSFVDACSDNLMIADFNARTVMNNDTKSLNYKILVYKFNIYLIGTVNSKRELDAVIGIAKSLVGVKKIVSYIKILDKDKNK